MTISKRITAIRKNLGLSASKFGIQIGVIPQTISTMERRDSKPSFDIIYGIMTKYPKLNPYWLILGEGKMWMNNTENNTPFEPDKTLKEPLIPYGDLGDQHDIKLLKNTIATQNKVIDHLVSKLGH